MSRTLFIILFILFSTSSFAQNIHFTDTTNVWTYSIHSCPDITIASTIVTAGYLPGDTVISGMTYKKLNAYTPAWVREDTIAHKVYVNNGTDWLLYDYALNVGDSFHVYPGTPDHWVFYVDQKDSVLINSIWHKTWHFTADTVAPGSSSEINSYTVIEGIGSDIHPLYPVMLPDNLEHCITLTCFMNRGAHPTVSPQVDGYFDNTSSCTLATVDVSIKNTKAFVVPNPINKTGSIILPDTIAAGTLVIYNVVGQMVVNTSFTNKAVLPIGDLVRSSGIYYYRVTDDKRGKVYTEKFAAQ